MKRKILHLVLLLIFGFLSIHVQAQQLDILDIQENQYIKITLIGPSTVQSGTTHSYYYFVEKKTLQYTYFYTSPISVAAFPLQTQYWPTLLSSSQDTLIIQMPSTFGSSEFSIAFDVTLSNNALDNFNTSLILHAPTG